MAAEAKIKVTSDTRSATTGIDGVEKKLSGLGKRSDDLSKKFAAMGKGLAGALAAGIGAAGVGSLFGEFDRIAKLASRLETSGETIQKLGRLAKLAGSDTETLARAMTRTTAALGGNDAASRKARESLASLGINADRFISVGLDEKVYMLADAYSASSGKGSAFSDVLDLIGLKGADLIPLFKQGSAELRKITDGMKVLGDSQLKEVEKINDGWGEFLEGLKVTGVELLLLIKKIGDDMGKVGAKIEDISGSAAEKSMMEDLRNWNVAKYGPIPTAVVEPIKIPDPAEYADLFSSWDEIGDPVLQNARRSIKEREAFEARMARKSSIAEGEARQTSFGIQESLRSRMLKEEEELKRAIMSARDSAAQGSSSVGTELQRLGLGKTPELVMQVDIAKRSEKHLAEINKKISRITTGLN